MTRRPGPEPRPRDPLRPRVEDLPEEPTSLAVTDDADFLAALAEAAEADGPATGSATLRVAAHPERVVIEGTIDAQLPVQCARCLLPFVLPVRRAFTQVLVRADATPADDDERELLAEELDLGELAGEELDLRAILREELVLALPGKPLHDPDCKGLCGGCGVDLNHEVCVCQPFTDPRWDALKALKRDD